MARRNRIQQLKTSIEYQDATIDSDIATRRAELAQAQARLDDLLAGSRPQEIQQAQAAVTDAKAWNDMAQARIGSARKRCITNEDISTSQYDQARTKVDSTAAQLRQAEERLALVQEGPRKEEIAAARAAVARAQAAVADRGGESHRAPAQGAGTGRAAVRRSTAPRTGGHDADADRTTQRSSRPSTAWCW